MELENENFITQNDRNGCEMDLIVALRTVMYNFCEPLENFENICNNFGYTEKRMKKAELHQD